MMMSVAANFARGGDHTRHGRTKTGEGGYCGGWGRRREKKIEKKRGGVGWVQKTTLVSGKTDFKKLITPPRATRGMTTAAGLAGK